MAGELEGRKLKNWTAAFFIVRAVFIPFMVIVTFTTSLLSGAGVLPFDMVEAIKPVLDQTFNIGQPLLFFLTLILFIAWFFPTYRNLYTLGCRSLSYGAGWAIGGFFIPVLNFFRPYQIAREIWRGSAPEGFTPDRNGRPPRTPLVTWWWVFFLAARLIGVLFLNNSAVDVGESVQTLMILAVWPAVETASNLLCFSLVNAVSHKQIEKYDRIRAEHGAGSVVQETASTS